MENRIRYFGNRKTAFSSIFFPSKWSTLHLPKKCRSPESTIFDRENETGCRRNTTIYRIRDRNRKHAFCRPVPDRPKYKLSPFSLPKSSNFRFRKTVTDPVSRRRRRPIRKRSQRGRDFDTISEPKSWNLTVADDESETDRQRATDAKTFSKRSLRRRSQSNGPYFWVRFAAQNLEFRTTQSKSVEDDRSPFRTLLQIYWTRPGTAGCREPKRSDDTCHAKLMCRGHFSRIIFVRATFGGCRGCGCCVPTSSQLSSPIPDVKILERYGLREFFLYKTWLNVSISGISLYSSHPSSWWKVCIIPGAPPPRSSKFCNRIRKNRWFF